MRELGHRLVLAAPDEGEAHFLPDPDRGAEGIKKLIQIKDVDAVRQ